MPTIETPSVGRSPIERILLCLRPERHRHGRAARSTSLPGHLLQLTIAGECDHNISGREITVRPGSFVWFHEDETVQTRIREVPWVYFSVNFIAPTLEPPCYSNRIQHERQDLAALFETIHTRWIQPATRSKSRDLGVHAALSDLLSRVVPNTASADTEDFAADLWWRIESQFRRDMTALHTLADLVKLTGSSPSTIARACQRVHQQSPMRRLKAIRLSMARGLVHQSTMRISEIADHVGYTRQHELARDYRRHFGASPTMDRKHPPR